MIVIVLIVPRVVMMAAPAGRPRAAEDLGGGPEPGSSGFVSGFEPFVGEAGSVNHRLPSERVVPGRHRKVAVPSVEIVAVPGNVKASGEEEPVEEQILAAPVFVSVAVPASAVPVLLPVFMSMFMPVTVSVGVVVGNRVSEGEGDVRPPPAREGQGERSAFGPQAVVAEKAAVNQRLVHEIPSVDVDVVLESERVQIAPPLQTQPGHVEGAVGFFEFPVDRVVLLVLEDVVDGRGPQPVAQFQSAGQFDPLKGKPVAVGIVGARLEFARVGDGTVADGPVDVDRRMEHREPVEKIDGEIVRGHPIGRLDQDRRSGGGSRGGERGREGQCESFEWHVDRCNPCGRPRQELMQKICVNSESRIQPATRGIRMDPVFPWLDDNRSSFPEPAGRTAEVMRLREQRGSAGARSRSNTHAGFPTRVLHQRSRGKPGFARAFGLQNSARVVTRKASNILNTLPCLSTNTRPSPPGKGRKRNATKSVSPWTRIRSPFTRKPAKRSGRFSRPSPWEPPPETPRPLLREATAARAAPAVATTDRPIHRHQRVRPDPFRAAESSEGLAEERRSSSSRHAL